MISRVVLPHRPEAVPTHMQGYGNRMHALFFDHSQQLLGEVQSGSGSCHCSDLPSIYGLISRLVFFLRLPLDVRRKGHFAYSLQDVEKIFRGIDLSLPASRFRATDNLAGQAVLLETNDRAGRDSLRGFEKNFPRALIQLLKEEHFHLTVVIPVCSEHAGREDPGLIYDQPVTLLQIVYYLMEHLMCQTSTFPVQDQKTGAVSDFGRIRSDQFLGQRVVEVLKGYAHFLNHLKNAVSTRVSITLTRMLVASGK